MSRNPPIRPLAACLTTVLLMGLLFSFDAPYTEAARRRIGRALVSHRTPTRLLHPDSQIPENVPAYGAAVETWWASHPFNPESPSYIPIGAITSPDPILDVRDQYGGDIQLALDALPSTGGTLYFDPGTYANDFRLVGRSNVHFISPGGAILSSGPSWAVGCEQALVYSQIANGVHSHDPESIACVTSGRIKNIYFKNLTFDGGGSATNALRLSAANGVVFDQVVFQNFHDPGDFHHGVVNGNVNLENVWFRGVHFAGRERWALYLDGAHFSGVVQSRIDYNFGDMDSSSGGLLFMTNADLNGDYNQNGAYEPNEKRNANYIVIAHNLFGASGPSSSMHTGIAMNGANILIKSNTVLRDMYRFALFMGKCDAINPGVEMRFDNLSVIGNYARDMTIFVHLDGSRYNCEIQNNTMEIGRYIVRDNSIDAPSLPALVWETNPPLLKPNLADNNCVGGRLYGVGTPCALNRSFVFLPTLARFHP